MFWILDSEHRDSIRPIYQYTSFAQVKKNSSFLGDTEQNKIPSHSHELSDLPIPVSDGMNILNYIKFEAYYCQVDPLFQNFLKERISNYSEVARKLNLSTMTLIRLANVKDYWINFQTLYNISDIFRIPLKEVYKNIWYIKTKNSFPIHFAIRNLTSPAFFRLVGHILGDGGIHVIKKEGKYRAFYVNNENVLLKSFIVDTYSLFSNVKLYFRKREEHGDEIWLPTTLGYLFYQILNYKELSEKRVPLFILQSKNKRLLHVFLQALFDDEGSVSVDKHMIVISLGNENLLRDIKTIVEKIGIRTNDLHKITPKNRSIMYSFSITSKENILKFYHQINFLHPLKRQKLQTLVNKYHGR